MRLVFNRNVQWMLKFVLKILICITVFNLAVLPILWVLEILYVFTIILVYEALFTLIIGVFQILTSYIYRENSIPFRRGFRTGWFDFKKFAKLKSEERKRYRQEGIILVIVGLVFLFGIVFVHLYSLFYS